MPIPKNSAQTVSISIFTLHIERFDIIKFCYEEWLNPICIATFLGEIYYLKKHENPLYIELKKKTILFRLTFLFVLCFLKK